jgi:hypothetical protein
MFRGISKHSPGTSSRIPQLRRQRINIQYLVGYLYEQVINLFRSSIVDPGPFMHCTRTSAQSSSTLALAEPQIDWTTGLYTGSTLLQAMKMHQRQTRGYWAKDTRRR